MEARLLVLQPVFDDAADPIPLAPALTLIGCEEPQVARFGEDHLALVEVRHARIIREADAPLLLDLSESGATTLNGEPVGPQPVPLSEGDLVRFGRQLEFRVDPMSQAAVQATRMLTESTPALQLLLTPVSEQSLGTPVAVTEFPFLVSSIDGHFATYQDASPEPVSFLSRRHAHVYQHDGVLMLEDLGSTNGTRLNDEALKGRAVPLNNGDEVRFGHRAFTFKATISVKAPEVSELQRSLPHGTVMISSAGSYLDVYCDDGAAASDGDVATAEPPELEARSPADHSASAGLTSGWRALRLRWQEWPFLAARQLGVFVLLPVLLVALAVTLLTRDTRLQQAQELLDQGESQTALQIAKDYQIDHPTDPKVSELVINAFESAALPGWIERMQSDEPAAALDFLRELEQLAPEMADSRSTALLRWMAELQQLLSQTNGTVAASMATDNELLRRLAAQWRMNSDHYTRLLRRFTDAYAELDPLHRRALSSVRALQGEGADQLAAVSQLHTEVSDLVGDSQFEQAEALIAAFAADHPKLRDMAAFSADLERLATMSRVRKDRDLTGFLALTENLAFETVFFRRLAGDVAVERQEAMAVQKQLARATALWSEGRLVPAVQSLSTEQKGTWVSALNEQRARYANLQEGFVELLALVGSTQYPDALIDFYARLDAEEDSFMRQALADDFVSQRGRATENADQLAAQGAEAWANYEQRFEGIGGGLRLESEVSDTYRELAGQLSQSVTLLQRAYRLCELLDVEMPVVSEEARQAALQEVLRQRNALLSLRYVLGDGVVQQKLALLPELALGT